MYTECLGERTPEAGGLLRNKNRICDVKMNILNVNFCLKFLTHNTVSHAKIGQSTELSQRLKQRAAH